jgi:hypothetical protein
VPHETIRLLGEFGTIWSPVDQSVDFRSAIRQSGLIIRYLITSLGSRMRFFRSVVELRVNQKDV